MFFAGMDTYMISTRYVCNLMPRNWLLLFIFWCVGVGWGREAQSSVYYINNTVTNGDVYTTAIGNDANSGTLPSEPKRTLTNLLATVSLVPGNVVYIDTGVYTNSVTIGTNHVGTAISNIVIIGSTNYQAGGTTLTSPGGIAVQLNANFVNFRNLIFRNSTAGVAWSAHATRRPQFDDCWFVSNTRGMDVGIGSGTGDSRIFRCLFVSNSVGVAALGLAGAFPRGFFVDQSVFWNNTTHIDGAFSDTDTVHNSVFVGGTVFNRSWWRGDYNVFWNINYVLNRSGPGGSTNYLVNLTDLQAASATNFFSTVADPRFANPGGLDFRPQSVQGRFNPVTGLIVTDAVHSILIDFGNPQSTAWTNEPAPNGGRLNIGLYGGLPDASRSRTNPCMQVLSYNDGGTFYGTNSLRWLASGVPSSATVRLEYSLNNGVSWLLIASNVPAYNSSFLWNASSITSSPIARWRVTCEATLSADTNRIPFALRGLGLVPYYVNDNSTAGDIYTTTVGNDANDGASPATPKATLMSVLTNYVLRGDHIVYVDSGSYTGVTIFIDNRTYGETNRYVVIQGSTNFNASTVFSRNSVSFDVFNLNATTFIELRNLTTRIGSVGVNFFENVRDSIIRQVISRENTTGYRVWSSQNNQFIGAVAAFNGTGLLAGNSSSGNTWLNGISWSNNLAAFNSPSTFMTIGNSILVGSTSFVTAVSQSFDYNIFWNTLLGGGFPDLNALQKSLSGWNNSTFADPQFSNPTNMWFFPRSIVGRYDPVTTNFVVDTTHSPLIDYGDPASTAWTNESSPNGQRINAGKFGGTLLASRSRTNAWLQALTYNDGGQLNVLTDAIRWNYGNLPTGATVRIEFSFNSGNSWNTFATNVSATSGIYTVVNTNFTSSRNTRWRIVLESDTSVAASNRIDFTFRNGPYRYYVNDASTAGDVYCTAPGNDVNLGTTIDLPKASVNGILTNFTLAAGDVIYIDTGVYDNSITITVSPLQSGTNGNPTVIQGSTNKLAGGTIIRGPPTATTPAFTLTSGLQDFALRDLTIQRRTHGVSISGASRILLERINLETNFQNGVLLNNASDIVLRYVVSRQNALDGMQISGGSNITIAHSVFWMNASNAVRTSGARLFVTNSAFAARGSSSAIYGVPGTTNVTADYNSYYVENNASIANVIGAGRDINTLGAWQSETGQDRFTTDLDPQFANPNLGDFHPRSQTVQGRFDPILGWTTDTTTSPLIDAGDPTADFSNETAPNGGRINIGIFGNTVEASRIDFARLYAANLTQGGWVRGTATLHWVASGLATDALVRVEVSPDGGETWSMLSTGSLASAEFLAWNTTTTNSFAPGLWRVTSLDNTNLFNQTTNFFSVRNQPLTFFVNNASTAGDVFTTAAGSATNWVASSNRPLNSLSAVFDRYDLEGGDTIRIDNGTYSVGAGVVIGPLDQGVATSSISIVGATLCSGGGEPLVELSGNLNAAGSGLFMTNAKHIAVSNIIIRQAGSGVRSDRGENLSFDGLRVYNAVTNAVDVRNGSGITFRNSTFAHNGSGWFGLSNAATRVLNSVIWSNGGSAVRILGGSVNLTNNVLQVAGEGRFVLIGTIDGIFRSDYNNILADNLADVASLNGKLLKFLSSWQQATTNDLRSLSHAAGFVNPATRDFHLQSTAGRFVSASCAVVTDLVSSVMIDAGDPSFAFAAEPAPNGGRINIGLYGNHPEASRSPTNGLLLTLTLNNGGTMRGTNVFYWFANSAVTGHQVFVDYSFDNGVTWTNIGTNLAASAGSYLWDSTGLPSTPLGRWRITSQTDPSVAATSAVAFTLNNGAITYYINDASTTGDVYTTAIDNSTNDGLTAATPVASLRDIFTRYIPAPGDRVLIDTGSYTFTNTVTLDANYSSAVATNPVVVQGSTNASAGGTRINLARQGPVITANGLANYLFRDLLVTNGSRGFITRGSTNITYEAIHYRSAANISDAGAGLFVSGFFVESSTNIVLQRIVVQDVTNRSDSAAVLTRAFAQGIEPSVRILNGVLWSNSFSVRALSASRIFLTNTLISASGPGKFALDLALGSSIQSDYNNVQIGDGAQFARLFETISATAPAMSAPLLFRNATAWQQFTGQDTNSLTMNPEFVEPENGNFSLRSRVGRYTPSGLVTDAVTSIMIDAGNPTHAFALEPAPNGSQVNLGHEGNTPAASLSTTSQTLFIRSYNDGGNVSGTNVVLRWDVRGDFTGTTVQVRLSSNNGLSWIGLASNIPTYNLQYSFNSLTVSSGFNYIWSVVYEPQPGINTRSDLPFAVRNTNVAFYVNDDVLAGDTYTTAIGISTNTGLTPNQPKRHLREVLDAYDLEPGDWVYIDTGVYALGDVTRIDQEDTGNATNPVYVIGSTNTSLGGSIFAGYGIYIEAGRGLVIENLNFEPVNTILPFGVAMQASTNVTLNNLRVTAAESSFSVSNSVAVTLRNSISRAARNRGLNTFNSRNVRFDHGVIWASTNRAVTDIAGVTITHSVLGASGSGRLLFEGPSTANLQANYNTYYVTDGARIGRISFPNESFAREYNSLTAWTRDTGRDANSLSTDPRFIDASQGRFHLRSQAGRWNPETLAFELDAETSPLVDAADPVAPFNFEQEPNGGRANIGPFGNTYQASLTPTNPVLLVGSLNDGGSVSGTNVTLYWVARGAATAHTARVEFSGDEGVTWTVIASNLPPGVSSVTWDTTLIPSTVLGFWRVVSETDPSVSGMSERPFAVRNGPVFFYVNDANATGDVYTTATGLSTNNGATPLTPMLSIAQVIARYDVITGDVIYVDTGWYSNNTSIVIDQLDVGFRLVGSTNTTAGGSRLFFNGTPEGIRLFRAPGVSIEHFRMSGANLGIAVIQSADVNLRHLELSGGNIGVSIEQSARTVMRNSAIRNANTGINLQQGTATDLGNLVLWSNATTAINANISDLSVFNSVFGVFGGPDKFAYILSQSTLAADYNAFHLVNGGWVGRQTVTGSKFPREWDKVGTWSRDTERDLRSLSGDPGFANAAQADFHPLSTAGRFDPATGTFVLDGATSPLVDAGSPFSPFALETSPNGGRVDIGMYGNSAEASRSPADGRLLAARFGDGGRAEGASVALTWRALGVASSHTVRVEYSTNNGAAWLLVQSNIAASAELLFTDTGSSAAWLGRWRVTSENDPGIAATNATPFQFRNQPLALYVNDGFTTGDVYSVVAGDNFNTGISPASPRLSLASVIADYDLEPGDTVYVDTGEYLLTTPVVIDQWDAFTEYNNLSSLLAGNPTLTIRGSTNEVNGGSRFIALNGSTAFALSEAYGVRLLHLGIRHFPVSSGTSITAVDAPFSSFDWVSMFFGNKGITLSDSYESRLRNLVAFGYNDIAIDVRRSTNVLLQSSVLYENQIGVNIADLSVLRARNNVLFMRKTDAVGWSRNDGPVISSIGILDADYNVLFASTNAFIAELRGAQYPGARRRFQRMVNWQNDTGLDLRSFQSDPRFANAAAGDFHPQSPFGRFVTGVGYITNGLDQLSPLIDAGDPSFSFGAEPAPNGSRINIGLYGNTAQASISPTNGTLQVVTFRDGGRGSSNIVLRWHSSGPVNSQLVHLEFSNDGGSTWTNIATNVVAVNQSYEWDSADFGRAAAGLWRISSQTDPSLSSTNEVFFALTQDGSIPYFVNDANTGGDVFTTAVGNNSNNGFLPSTPKASLQALLNEVDLEPGDVVYVDTGNYAGNIDIVIGELDSGSSNRPVVIRGSTNLTSNGTVFDRITKQGNAIRVDRAEGVKLQDLTVINGENGVGIELSKSVTLENVRAVENRLNGVLVAGSTGTRLQNNLLWKNGTNGVALAQRAVGEVLSGAEADLFNNTIWGSRNAVNVGVGAQISARNNLMQASGSEGRIYLLGLEVTNVVADYNAYYRQANALLAERVVGFGGNQFFPRLLDWQRDRGNDLRSLSHDPQIVNAAIGDFALQSASGRFQLNGTLTNDPFEVYSPLIDTGDPTFIATNESLPNGARVNIGHYGNTTLASRSRTNGWLVALSLNDGGLIRGTNTIRWAAGNWPTNSRVRFEYALNGVDYSVVASNIPVYTDGFVWDASGEPVTQLARWRVISETDTNTLVSVASPFTIKNQALQVYVNDANTSGDIYTTAVGSDTNDGLAINRPLLDPGAALDRYPFGPGDVLYVDTGSYFVTNPLGMRLGLVGDVLKSGEPGSPIRLVGSTNTAGGGSVIQGNPFSPAGFRINETKHIDLSHLTFVGNSNGLEITSAEDINLNWVGVRNNVNGFVMNNVISGRFSRAAAWSNQRWGLQVNGAYSSISWNNGAMFANVSGAVQHVFGSLQVNNSAFVTAPTNTSVIIEINSSVAAYSGDYNVFWTGTNTTLMSDSSLGIRFGALSEWQKAWNADLRSIRTDPLFVNPSSGDFHLLSQNGRYSPFLPGFVFSDTATSWAIDAGDPALPSNLETLPNGNRINVGRFGNTTEASRSTTNAGLLAVAMRDGGIAPTPLPLIWLARGVNSNATVTLEYSVNGGIVWEPVITGYPATNGQYVWDSGSITSTPIALWRVTLDALPSVADTSGVFTIRNGPIRYFVNDSSTTGDIYTTSAGDPDNIGTVSNAPMSSISAVLARYNLEGGDTIYVDTGFYALTNNIRILADDSGVVTNRMVIQGSTNWFEGGTILHRVVTNAFAPPDQNNESVIELVNVSHIELADMVLEGANIGIYFNNIQPTPGNMYFRNLLIRDCGFSGINMNQSSSNTLERVVVTRGSGDGINVAGSDLYLLNSIIWSNAGDGIAASGGGLRISNSVLHAYGNVTNGALALNQTLLLADYNNFFVQGGASYAVLSGEPIAGLPQFTQRTTQNVHSVSVDPLFHDAAADDYHPRSPAGRFDPVSGLFVTSDPEFSWIIDTGNPADTFNLETDPNGARRNIGLYGNTSEASRSRTNEWLLAVTAMAGGRIGGIFSLYWFYGNLDPTNRVDLDYSIDSGTNWSTIAVNIPIDQDGYLWNSLSANPFRSPTTKWRVTLVGNTNVNDQTDRIFGLNGPFTFYVNDTNTAGDVYTTSAGDDANLGIASNAPKATLRAILDSWDIDPEDIVLLDTGYYVITSNDIAKVRLDNGGNSVNPVIIRGSTNGVTWDAVGITEGVSGPIVLEIEAAYVELERVSLFSAGIKAAGTNITLRDVSMQRSSVELAGPLGIIENYQVTNGLVKLSGNDVLARSGYVRNGGLELLGDNSRLINSVVAGSNTPLVKISGVNVQVLNNTLVANQTAIQQIESDSLSVVRNNILVANGITGNGYCIETQGGVVQSDFNLFSLRNGAWFGNAQDGLWERLIYWQQNSRQDTNSITGDPVFADEPGGDFRVKSVTGRWNGSGFTADGEHSPAIDAGAPFDEFLNETAPNGNRINIGAFGNTAQASRSRTNAWLYAITMNDGGVLRGTNTLRWLSGAVDPTNRVTLQYSTDGGANWLTIVSDVAVSSGAYVWDASTATNSLDALWRVVLEANTNVQDTTDSIFNIRNDVLSFYVNDTSTTGDVYTTAPGNDANDGRTPATPKATLENLLAAYDTEPSDIIYVDTGVYTSSIIRVIWSRGGSTNGQMVIQGSTNTLNGGTVIRRPTRQGDVMLVNASYVTLRDLVFQNGQRGLTLQTNRFNQLIGIGSSTNDIGVRMIGGSNHIIRSSRIWNNSRIGLDIDAASPVTVQNITFVNNREASIQALASPNLTIQNNIFYHDVATSNAQAAIAGATGTVFTANIDYNVYFFGPASRSNTFIYSTFTNLLTWQRLRFLDFRSAVTNPLFHSVATDDFHLQSQAGRFDTNLQTFVMDTNTSWAIDRGNPFLSFTNETMENGGRINIGAYGNTYYASRGVTNQIVQARTADAFLPISELENPYPLTWYMLNVPFDFNVSVQYSGDGGTEWTTLQSGVPAYQEYIVWTNSPTFNSFNARWRIVGEGPGNTNYWDINDGQIRTFFGVHRVSAISTLPGNSSRIVWRGAWDENYQIQYATNFVRTNREYVWINLGDVTNLTVGGDIPYIDLQASNDVRRVYRVLWLGTNGVPYQ